MKRGRGERDNEGICIDIHIYKFCNTKGRERINEER
jgi:hypothetical protein